MKTILFFLLLKFTAFSQPYVIAAVEPMSGTITARAGAVSDHLKVGVNFDYLQGESYQKFTFDVGRRFYLGANIEIIPTVEFGFINRDGGFFTHGLGVETAYFIKENLGIVLIANINKRKDLDIYQSGNNYRPNMFIGMLYKFRNPVATRW